MPGLSGLELVANKTEPNNDKSLGFLHIRQVKIVLDLSRPKLFLRSGLRVSFVCLILCFGGFQVLGGVLGEGSRFRVQGLAIQGFCGAYGVQISARRWRLMRYLPSQALPKP